MTVHLTQATTILLLAPGELLVSQRAAGEEDPLPGREGPGRLIPLSPTAEPDRRPSIVVLPKAGNAHGEILAYVNGNAVDLPNRQLTELQLSPGDTVEIDLVAVVQNGPRAGQWSLTSLEMKLEDSVEEVGDELGRFVTVRRK